jgi:hypothetical protein
MGEHTEDMAKSWNISREVQDELALGSHQRSLGHALIPLFSRAANRAPIRMKASLRSNRRKIDYLAIGAMQYGRLLEGYLSGRNRACKCSVGKIAK